MSSTLNKLLWWSAGLMVIALIVQRIQMNNRLTIIVGLVEVLLAVVTGIAFGVVVARTNPRSDR